MENSADKRNLNLTLNFILSVFISTLMFSCGPRSGISEDKVESEAWCGTKSTESEIGVEKASGSKLFKQNCAACHSVTDQKFTAVGLGGVADRLPKPAEEYFIKYTLNNEKLYFSGDSYARKLKKRNMSPMPVFDSILTQQDARLIYQYLTSPMAKQN
jgi:cytochrome c